MPCAVDPAVAAGVPRGLLLALIFVWDADKACVKRVDGALSPVGANALSARSSVLDKASAASIDRNLLGIAGWCLGSTSRVDRCLSFRWDFRCFYSRGFFDHWGLVNHWSFFAGGFAASYDFFFVGHSVWMLPIKRTG